MSQGSVDKTLISLGLVFSMRAIQITSKLTKTSNEKKKNKLQPIFAFWFLNFAIFFLVIFELSRNPPTQFRRAKYKRHKYELIFSVSVILNNRRLVWRQFQKLNSSFGLYNGQRVKLYTHENISQINQNQEISWKIFFSFSK